MGLSQRCSFFFGIQIGLNSLICSIRQIMWSVVSEVLVHATVRCLCGRWLVWFQGKIFPQPICTNNITSFQIIANMKINQIISDLVFSSLSIELLGKWFVLLACGFSKRFFLWRTQKTWHWNRKTNTRPVTHRILERKKIELPKKQSFGIGFVILWQIQVEKKADF